MQLGLAIKDDYERVRTLRKIAVAQMQAGDATNAHATLAKIQQFTEVLQGDEFDRAFAWRNLAMAQWGVGERRMALETMQQAAQHAKKVPDKHNRAGALRQISMAWANLGEHELARNAAEAIPPEENKDMVWARGETFYELAKAKSAGNVKAALALVSEAEPVGDWQDSLRAGIAALQAKSGNLDGARATAKQIVSGTRRVEGLLSIATELARPGKSTRPVRSLATCRNSRDGGPGSGSVERPSTTNNLKHGRWSMSLTAILTIARHIIWPPWPVISPQRRCVSRWHCLPASPRWIMQKGLMI